MGGRLAAVDRVPKILAVEMFHVIRCILRKAGGEIKKTSYKSAAEVAKSFLLAASATKKSVRVAAAKPL